MRPSEDPVNLRWSRALANKHTWEFKNQKADIESEAALGMVRAEAHPDCPNCPGGDEFRAFAYSFVTSAICDYTRKLRRHAEIEPVKFELELVHGRDEEPSVDEWPDLRLSLADKLHGDPRRVFLLVYGELECTRASKVAKLTNKSISWVKKQHAAAMEALRDLPDIQLVA